jgi:hypothetical protein
MAVVRRGAARFRRGNPPPLAAAKQPHATRVSPTPREKFSAGFLKQARYGDEGEASGGAALECFLPRENVLTDGAAQHVVAQDTRARRDGTARLWEYDDLWPGIRFFVFGNVARTLPCV